MEPATLRSCKIPALSSPKQLCSAILATAPEFHTDGVKSLPTAPGALSSCFQRVSLPRDAPAVPESREDLCPILPPLRDGPSRAFLLPQSTDHRGTTLPEPPPAPGPSTAPGAASRALPARFPRWTPRARPLPSLPPHPIPPHPIAAPRSPPVPSSSRAPRGRRKRRRGRPPAPAAPRRRIPAGLSPGTWRSPGAGEGGAAPKWPRRLGGYTRAHPCPGRAKSPARPPLLSPSPQAAPVTASPLAELFVFGCSLKTRNVSGFYQARILLAGRSLWMFKRNQKKNKTKTNSNQGNREQLHSLAKDTGN